jgi:hypothetical protein
MNNPVSTVFGQIGGSELPIKTPRFSTPVVPED